MYVTVVLFTNRKWQGFTTDTEICDLEWP